jgi:hypothetical protein
VSDIWSEALEKAAFGDSLSSKDPISREREALLLQSKALEKREQEEAALQEQEKARKQGLLDDFLTSTSDTVLTNPIALNHWANRTGISIKELKVAKLKKLASEMGQKKLDPEQERLRAKFAEVQKME